MTMSKRPLIRIGLLLLGLISNYLRRNFVKLQVLSMLLLLVPVLRLFT